LGHIGKKPEEIIVFEDAIAGLQAAKNAKTGKIIAVNSNDDDYSDWKDCQIIKSFDEVDRTQFRY
jgi:beta-phosphoglucomutase-like phosphatase (HAD superfamily)